MDLNSLYLFICLFLFSSFSLYFNMKANTSWLKYLTLVLILLGAFSMGWILIVKFIEVMVA